MQVDTQTAGNLILVAWLCSFQVGRSHQGALVGMRVTAYGQNALVDMLPVIFQHAGDYMKSCGQSMA